MKFAITPLLAVLLLVSARTSAQKITYSGSNVSLPTVFDVIRQQTGYGVFIEDALLSQTKNVTLNVKDATIGETMTKCLKQQPVPIDFYIAGRSIILKKKGSSQNHPSEDNSDTSRSLPFEIRGHVIDSLGHPLAGVSVTSKNGRQSTVTDQDGNFTLNTTSQKTTILLSSIGYETREYKVSGNKELQVQMRISVRQLSGVEVVYSTGYQTIPKERATGSFAQVDKELINRSVSPDIMSRLQYVTSGLLLSSSNETPAYFSVRGRSTILANSTPLIVVDNFEYNGDINNLNPNDVESVTVLKDAAAASIWGAKAGNGVIVIVTKKGLYNQKAHVTLNSNITTSGKPDLYAMPIMSSSDYSTSEKFLFGNNYYQGYIQSPSFYQYKVLSPVINLLNQASNGQISQSEADARIAALSAHDIRSDYQKYLYRRPLLQQYSASISGGSDDNTYYVSFGYDKNVSTVRGNDNNRISVDINNTHSLLDHKLDITTRLIYTQTHANNNGLPYGTIPNAYPYSPLANANGTPLPIAQYNQDFLDTVGSGRFLDWTYVPLNEQKFSNKKTTGQDYQANLALKYRVMKGLSVDINYLYARGSLDNRNLYSPETYYTRNLINQFIQYGGSDNGLYFPIPVGGILQLNNSDYISQNVRGQVNYSKTWDNSNQLNVIAGGEINDLHNTSVPNVFYGYDDTHVTSIPVDYTTSFTNVLSGYGTLIPSFINQTDQTDRYVSYYGNAAFTYHSKYTLSGSLRKNSSNLFGVNANQKGIPLWSIGAGWELSKESFFNTPLISYLRLRATYGYSGNVDKSVTAFLVSRNTGTLNRYLLNESTIQSPPNAELRWEKDGMFNVGVDFSSHNSRISGSIEYYIKNGTDLMGFEPLPMSSGINGASGSAVKKNSADMKGTGIDIKLNTRVIDAGFKWNLQFLFSYAADRVTSYKLENSILNDYVIGNNPIVGKPVSSLYSYRWAGLDNMGNPQGYIDGKTPSTDYSSIMNGKELINIEYNGPAQPTVFGGLLNTFTYRQVSLSFNIVYRMGYYFRRPSVNYTDLFNGLVTSKDFAQRWQNTGDEKKTSVPSMVFPDDPTRDQFYTYSSTLVTKGDHIRLQDIQISYDLNKQNLKRLPFANLRLYGYAANLGILWKANKNGLDPNVATSLTGYPTLLSLSVGCKIDF